MNDLTYKTAIHIAEAASAFFHRDQLYGDEPYYQAHIIPAIHEAMANEKLVKQDDRTRALSYLVILFHDTIEDEKATQRDIMMLLTPILGETDAGYVTEAVAILARDKNGETYAEYIDRLLRVSGFVRLLVLLAKESDLRANITAGEISGGKDGLLKRYYKALDKIASSY